jgi:hypothetical protein
MRPRIAFFDPGELSLPAQKSSGDLIRSVSNESTDFTNPDRGLLSKPGASGGAAPERREAAPGGAMRLAWLRREG